MIEVALEAISLHRWRFSELNCVKFPLHEVDSLLAHQNPHGAAFGSDGMHAPQHPCVVPATGTRVASPSDTCSHAARTLTCSHVA